jgi:hypothetical protein
MNTIPPIHPSPTKNPVRHIVWEQVRDQVESHVLKQLWPKVGIKYGDSPLDQVFYKVWFIVRKGVWDQFTDHAYNRAE